MSDHAEPGSAIPIASVPNLRDLGGWSIRDDGSTRWGVVYRSTELHELADRDVGVFTDLGITSVYDLRTEAERAAQPDRVLSGVDNVHLDVLADSAVAAPADVLSVIADPTAADDLLGGGKAEQLFVGAYRSLITLPSARAGYRRLFTDIAVSRRGAVLFHCTTGKDRTGWAAAALLLFVGVAQDDVVDEYMLTNDELLPHLQPTFDAFEASGGDRELLLSVLGVAPEYLLASIDEMHARHGDIEGYFTDGLGIDAATQAALRSRLID